MAEREGILIPGFCELEQAFRVHGQAQGWVKQEKNNEGGLDSFVYRNFERPAHLKAELFDLLQLEGQRVYFLYLLHRSDLPGLAAVLFGKTEGIGNQIVMDEKNEAWLTDFSIKRARHKRMIIGTSKEDLEEAKKAYQELGLKIDGTFRPVELITNILTVKDPVH